MPKYYIKSGDLKLVIDKPDYEQAIISTLKYYKGSKKIPSHKICVSETGFQNFKNWICYDTYSFIKGLDNAEDIG